MGDFNQAHSGMRMVVSLVGDRNAGKSSLLNKIVGQEVSIVSEVKGTTTDAVVKAYELIGAGPVSFYDTAGLDDIGELGKLRVKASLKVINRSDLVLVVIGKNGITPDIENLIHDLVFKKVPFIPVFTYSDECKLGQKEKLIKERYKGVIVSNITGDGIDELKKNMVDILNVLGEDPFLIGDMIKEKDVVMLITPVDLAAPKGRLIMPQVQVLREVLDCNAMGVVVKENEASDMLTKLAVKPSFVVTDSQVVKEMSEVVPDDVRFTTFSTLFARYKGNFKKMLEGAKKLDSLKDGDKVLIAEGCSHHITCDDIGRVKIPNLIKKYTKKEIVLDFVSGVDFPENLNDYKLVIHCGGCVLNRMEMKRRLDECIRRGVSITNYGLAISKMNGVLDRIVKDLKY